MWAIAENKDSNKLLRTRDYGNCRSRYRNNSFVNFIINYNR